MKLSINYVSGLVYMTCSFEPGATPEQNTNEAKNALTAIATVLDSLWHSLNKERKDMDNVLQDAIEELRKTGCQAEGYSLKREDEEEEEGERWDGMS